MNRLFNALKRFIEGDEKPAAVPKTPTAARVLEGFEGRVEVLYRYAQRAAEYEDDLDAHFEQVRFNLDRAQSRIEKALDDGRDRDAFEFVRLAVRLRPQYELLDYELRAFRAVAGELLNRVGSLMDNLDEARALAARGDLNPAATQRLDTALTRLTRYFVMLERVTAARRRELPEKLAARMTLIIDDRQLDLELARYVLQRRRMLGMGTNPQADEN